MRALAVIPLLCLASCNAERATGDDRFQDPIAFRVVNPSGGSLMWMDWTHEGLTELHGRVPGEFDFLWFHPPCTADCDEIPEGECGCLECEPADPVMLEFGPFGEVLIEWEGPQVYTVEEDACGCPCVRERHVPVPSELIVGLVSWESYACTVSGCGPDADGIILGAGPDGERLCATRFLDLPFDDGEFTLLMGTVCDSDWP
jgi:hypothetical protein